MVRADRRTNTNLFFALAAFLYGISFWSTSAVDPDLGWHLLGGEYVSRTGTVPRLDFINLFNSEWHDYHWLAQLGMARVFEFGGFPAMMVLLGVSVALCFSGAIFTAQSAVRGVTLSATMLIGVVITILGLSSIVSHRPQIFALAVLMWSLGLLVVRKKFRFEILIQFALTALLVNMHVYWVFIPTLWFFYRVAGASSYRAALHGASGLIVLLFAPLLSPYGLIETYALLKEYTQTPEILNRTLLEFKSSLNDDGAPRWILLASLVAVSRGLHWKVIKIRRGDFFSAVLGGVLAVMKVKFIGVFAVLSVPLMVRVWPRVLVLPEIFVTYGTEARRTVAVAVICGSVLYAAFNTPLKTYDGAVLKYFYPIDACQTVAQEIKEAGYSRRARVLTSFDYGGWCSWQMLRTLQPEQVGVTADGRTQGLSNDYYKKLFDLFQVKGEWLTTLKDWDLDFAVVSKNSPLAQFMALAPQAWTLIFQDGEHAVFKVVRQ